LKGLIRHLGSEGTSSDESDIEGYRVVYRTKTLPWRHPEIADCMESIEEHRLGVPTFSTKGSKPAERIRDGIPSTRPHVDGLPDALYDPQWKEEPKNKTMLNVSDEKFPWIRWKAISALGRQRE
jgi:hypothetical protein